MDILEVKTILVSIKFRDWWFRVEQNGTDFWLQACFNTVEGEQHGRKWRLSQFMTKGEVVRTAFAACLRAAEHEAREDFFYAGVRIFGPHIDVDALWHAADQIEVRK